jgi:transposase
MVRELIRREFGVRLSEPSVGRLLRKLGLSPQRPLYRAWQGSGLGST